MKIKFNDLLELMIMHLNIEIIEDEEDLKLMEILRKLLGEYSN